MSSLETSFGCPDYGSSRRCDGRVLAIVAASLVVASGCGSGQGALFPQASVEIIRGKDSAGATIELEKRGDDLAQARVIDIVLGAGEAEIISDENGNIEFTIDFPGGAAITYDGRQAYAGEPDKVMFSGTWRQHPGGVFGEDFGTWQAQSRHSGIP